MIPPAQIDSQTITGSEWTIPFHRETTTIVPTSYIAYTNSSGSKSLRFRNYKDNVSSSQTKDEEVDEPTDEDLHRFSTSFMNVILDDEWDTLEEDSKYFDPSNANDIRPFLVKYTPPPSSKININEVKPTGWNEYDHKILYLKELFGYTLSPKELEEMEVLLKKQGQLSESQIIYQDDLKNIRMTPKEDNLLDSYLTDSVKSVNFTLMDDNIRSSVTGPTPGRLETMNYETGRPPHAQAKGYNEPTYSYRNKGRRLPTDPTFTWNSTPLLNLTDIHPQLWNSYLETWSQEVHRDYTAKYLDKDINAEVMISIAENYLGTTVLSAWEDWKKHFPEPLAQLVSQGNNIRNFTSTILRIINGGGTLSGLTIKQNEALRDLEQLQLHDWKKMFSS